MPEHAHPASAVSQLLRSHPSDGLASAAVRRILTFHGLEMPDQRLTAAISKVEDSPEKNRFNKGISGRGREGLTSAQKARILRLAAYYPGIDFSLFEIGGED